MEQLVKKLNGTGGVSRINFRKKLPLPHMAGSKPIFVPGVSFDLECNLSHSDIMNAAKTLGFEMPEPTSAKHFFHPLNPGMTISFASPDQKRRIRIGENTHFAIVSRETLKDKTRQDVINLLKTLLRRSAS